MLCLTEVPVLCTHRGNTAKLFIGLATVSGVCVCAGVGAHWAPGEFSGPGWGGVVCGHRAGRGAAIACGGMGVAPLCMCACAGPCPPLARPSLLLPLIHAPACPHAWPLQTDRVHVEPTEAALEKDVALLYSAGGSAPSPLALAGLGQVAYGLLRPTDCRSA